MLSTTAIEAALSVIVRFEELKSYITFYKKSPENAIIFGCK